MTNSKSFVVVLITIFALIHSTPTASDIETCETPTCKAIALELLNKSMNLSVDPCDNFYEFVCGKWSVAHRPVTEGTQEWNVYEELAGKIQNQTFDAIIKAPTGRHHKSKAVQFITDFYRECSQTDNLNGVASLIELIDSMLGDWPMLRSHPRGAIDELDWPQLYTRVYSRTGLGIIFQFTVTGLSTKHLTIEPITNEIGRNRSSSMNDLTDYRDYIQKSALLLGAPNDQQLTNDINEMIELETSLAKLTSVSGSTFDFETLNDDTNSYYSRLDWLKLVNSILIKHNNSKLSPFYSFDSVIYDKYYLNRVIEILDSTPVSVVRNLFGWHIFQRYGLYSTEQFRVNIAKYNKTAIQSPELACRSLINDNYPWVLGRVFVDRHLSPQIKKEAELMVKRIKNTFDHILRKSNWLDEKTLNFTREKLHSIKQNVAFPEWIKSDTLLDSLYDLSGVKVKKGQFLDKLTHIQALARINQFKQIDYSIGGSGIDVTSGWGMSSVMDVNAYYYQNAIIIPAAILLPPFFDPNRPFVMNYGSIGTIIGHEFTHAFDSLHHESYSWSEISNRQYNVKTKCLEDEYGQIRDRVVDMSLDGKYTENENIADNGGLHEAFRAYRAYSKRHGQSQVLPYLKLSSDQLFFLSNAMGQCDTLTKSKLVQIIELSSHAPDRYRVNVVMRNSAQFAKAFNCPLGSNMNPKQKCTLW